MRGTWLVVLAVFATGLLAACGNEGGEDADRGDGTGSVSLTEEAARDGAADALGGAGGAPAPGSSNQGSGLVDRKIVFRAALELEANDVAASFDRVGAIARDAGGFVEKSSFSNSDDPQRRRAMLTLRVPVAQFDEVLAALRSLDGAPVRNESSQSTEVTEQYTDLQSRLRNLERVESQYLELLARASTVQDILAVQDRLNNVRLEIEQVQGQIQVLDDLVAMASVDATLVPLARGDYGGPKSFGEAFADAWEAAIEAFRYTVSAAAVVAVAAIWLAIPALAVVLGVRWFGRRGSAAG